MNSRLLVAFLCLAAVSTGCVIHDDDCCYEEPIYPGDVTFRWTFDGFRCSDDPDIKGVNITIPGESLANGGRYPCQANGFDGIVLRRFAPGIYSFNLEAVSYDNEVLYEASGTFTVNGDVTVDIDLTPAGLPPSYAYVSWLFPGNITCGQAGVATVDARVDGGSWATFDCARGQNGNSIQSPHLDPGSHYLELAARDSQGRTLYTHGGQLTTTYGAPTSYTATLRSSSAGALISWKFQDTVNSNVLLGCGAAGVTRVEAIIDGGNKATFDCSAGSNGGSVSSPTLQPGTHDLQLLAFNSAGRPWYFFSRQFSVSAGSDTNLEASMWPVGGTAIKWELRSGGSAQNCAQAGITSVAINFRDVFTGERVYGIAGDSHGCNDAPVVYEFLKPGRYEVEMYARSSTGAEYFSVDNAVITDVVAHSFPSASSALLVTMIR
ncbi:hypothetical protein LZ198_38935 [Myxococcus sp. K15C18031901]|uniref:hypothetical protein n=1 Tax=Myxococcus dinghuensis TaxID=2906761 RepID=UPI0020A737BA|nr:hypothetical protein [Myxococcus dinghuensis]MCP3104859.1 hypothetical protein [Myxococcus dinghuensis]